MESFSVVILALLSASVIQSVLAAKDAQAELQNKIKLGNVLAKDYEKKYAPGNTTLKLKVSFICAQYDMEDKHLHSRVYERYSWKDWRLRWDPSKYGGVNVLKVPANLLWKPDDVRLFNAVDETEERDDSRVVIVSDGTIYWVTQTTYTTVCGPGEKVGDRKGHCHISLGSWVYDAEDLPLELDGTGAETKYYLDDCPHVISNVQARVKETKYDCCPDHFNSLEIDFDLEARKNFKSHDSSSESEEDEKPKGKPKHRSFKTHRSKLDCEWPHC